MLIITQAQVLSTEIIRFMDFAFIRIRIGTVEINEDNFVNLYPIPFSSSATLEFSNPRNKKYQFKIYTLQGKLVFVVDKISGTKVLINGEGLPAGTYFFSLVGEGERAQVWEVCYCEKRKVNILNGLSDMYIINKKWFEKAPLII